MSDITETLKPLRQLALLVAVIPALLFTAGCASPPPPQPVATMPPPPPPVYVPPARG